MLEHDLLVRARLTELRLAERRIEQRSHLAQIRKVEKLESQLRVARERAGMAQPASAPVTA